MEINDNSAVEPKPAKKAKVKSKYPADRTKTSEAFIRGDVHTDVMVTHPRVIITIGGEHKPDVVNDIQNAIDEVLAYHGK